MYGTPDTVISNIGNTFLSSLNDRFYKVISVFLYDNCLECNKHKVITNQNNERLRVRTKASLHIYRTLIRVNLT